MTITCLNPTPTLRRVSKSYTTGSIAAQSGTTFDLTFDVPTGYQVIAVSSWSTSAWEVAITRASIMAANKLTIYVFNAHTAAHSADITVSVLCAPTGYMN